MMSRVEGRRWPPRRWQWGWEWVCGMSAVAGGGGGGGDGGVGGGEGGEMWRGGSDGGAGPWRRGASWRRRPQDMTPEISHDRRNFLAATMRIFLVVSPPGKLQVSYVLSAGYLCLVGLRIPKFQLTPATNFVSNSLSYQTQ